MTRSLFVNKTETFKWLSAIVVALVGTAGSACARSNVLVLFTDDQRASTIGALGNPEMHDQHRLFWDN